MIAIGATMWLGVATVAEQDMLQLDAPPPIVLPSGYLQQRLSELRQPTPAIEEKLGGEGHWRVAAWRHYRQTAATLIDAAMQPGTSDVAAIIGVTLADGAPELERLLVAAQGDPPAAVAQLTGVVPNASTWATSSDVVRFTQHQLCPLIALQQRVAPSEPWSSAWPPTSAPPTAQDVGTLIVRAVAVAAPPRIRDPIVATLMATQAALRFAEFLPLVDQTYRDMLVAVNLLNVCGRASWIPDELRQRLLDQLAASLEAYRDPATRQDASDGLLALRTITWTIEDAGRWREEPAYARTAESMAGNAVRVQLSDASAPQRLAVFRWHRQAREAIDSTRGIAPPTQPTFRSAFVTAHRELEQSIDAAVRASTAMAQSPTMVNTPAMTQPLRTLIDRAAAVVAISKLKAAMDATDAYKPVPVNGVRLRMVRLAEEARADAEGGRALDEIAQFIAQYERYAQLPGEAAMRRREVAPLLRTKAPHLVSRIDAARSEWATAWASGRAPEEAADRIEMLRDALMLIAQVRSATSPPGWTLAPAMNDWGGWQGDPQAMRALFEPLEQAVVRIIDQTYRLDLDPLRTSVEQIESEQQLAIAVLRIAAGPISGPDGFAGILSQTLFTPAADAYLGDHRESLAQLNRSVNEWARADEAQRDELRGRGLEAIRRLRSDLPALREGE